MCKKTIRIFFVSFLFCFSAYAAPTPSERYFEEVISLDELKNHCLKSHFYELDEHLQFYFDIIEYEHLNGFFGYHGCSQQYRIFQDILRAVFEEALDIPIPADFQFLRIPGEPQFNFAKGVASFYDQYDRKKPNKKIFSFFISEVILEKINARWNTNISLDKLTPSDAYALWFLCEDMFVLIDTHSLEDLWGYMQELYPFEEEGEEDVDEMRSMGFGIATENKLNSQKTYLKMLSIISMLSLQMPLDLQHMGSAQVFQSKIVSMLRPYLSDISSSEIISYIDKELNPQALLLQLLQVMYEQQPNEIYWHYVFPYNDVREEQRSLVVALNISLFGNYFRWDESTLSVYGNNRSVEGGEDKVYSFLKDYFLRIGLDPSIIFSLVRIAEEELKQAQTETGCILQFFDKSSRLYEELERMAYTSHSFGIPIKTTPLSNILLAKHPLRLKSMDYQARILTSNSYTLNPFGRLGILRHDLTHPKIAQRIIERMKVLIKQSLLDTTKRDFYKVEMQKLWELR